MAGGRNKAPTHLDNHGFPVAESWDGARHRSLIADDVNNLGFQPDRDSFHFVKRPFIRLVILARLSQNCQLRQPAAER